MRQMPSAAIATALSAVLAALAAACASAAEVSLSADLVSRYVWRGMDVNGAANVQPSLDLRHGGFGAGLWGSYSLALADEDDDDYAFGSEIDFWAAYGFSPGGGSELSVILTDYYYPNAGIGLWNWNDHDDPEGPGAHLVEAGLILSGPEDLPLAFSAYVNIYNDAGNSAYFQVDYLFSLGSVDMDVFAGAALGSAENPGYYGTDGFDVINVGLRASRGLPISSELSLPLFAAFILNPHQETAWLVFGLTI